MKKFISYFLFCISSFVFFSCDKFGSKGELKIYATCLEDYISAVCEKFENETGIKTSYELFSSTAIMENAEKMDGKPTADIWFGGTSETFNYAASKGLLYSYNAKNAKHLINSKYKDKDGYWYGIYMGVLGFFWDSSELDKRNILPPFDWDDLLKPEYNGLVTFGNPATSGTGKIIVNTLVQLKGFDGAIEYFKKLDKNIFMYPSHGVFPARMVSSGEAVIGIGFMHDILREMILKDNSNIGMTTPISGTSYEIGASAIFKGAKNLENAKRFIEFTLSPACVNLAPRSGSYQFLLLDNTEPVEAAISACLDKIETIDYNQEDAKLNGDKYYEAFYNSIVKDDRLMFD